MSYEIGSAASYREFLISGIGIIPRTVHEFIPPPGLKLMELFPVNPFFPTAQDGTGWRAFGRRNFDYEEWDLLGPLIDNLFNILEKKGYQIECRETVKLNLLHGERVYLFLRRHLILREMIVLYPVGLSEIFYVKNNQALCSDVLYPNTILDLVVNRPEYNY